MAHRLLSRMSKARAVRNAWNHLIAADAANHAPQSAFVGDVDAVREVELAEALDALIVLSHEDTEFLELISVMLDTLSCSNPMASAFLCHVIDMAALPSKETTRKITELILHKLKGGLLSTRARKRIRQNAAIIWGVLAERLAGEISLSLFQDLVCDCLLQGLRSDADVSVRLFSLVALEKFALTGQNKQKIMSHPLNVRQIMTNIVTEFDGHQQQQRPKRRQLQLSDSKTSASNSTLHALHQCRLVRRFSFPKRNHEPEAGEPRPQVVEAEAARKAEVHEEAADHQSLVSAYANLIGSGKACDEQFRIQQLRFCTEWALKNTFGSYEATKATTGSTSTLLSVSTTPNSKDTNVMMNMLDATSHWKMAENGLEIRNDHSTFESIRATMSVMSGRWYYEVTLLTSGIMQIGWATRKCHFGPEDGTGVGDDDHGFGFDGCRNVIWSNGTSLFPPSQTLPPCRAGDVIGSLLDLDAGNCTFYVNGRDYGISIEFDKPQMRRYVGDPMQQHLHHHGINLYHGRQTIDHLPHSRRHPSNAIAHGASMGTGFGVIGAADEQVCLGLYPAMSLTSYQHVMVNFGKDPWRYPPLTKGEFSNLNERGTISDDLRAKILQSTRRQSHSPSSRFTSSSSSGATSVSASSTSSPRASLNLLKRDDLIDGEDDDDRNKCSICFNHPPSIVLKPCGHDGFCMACSMVMKNCPHCRSPILLRRPRPISLATAGAAAAGSGAMLCGPSSASTTRSSSPVSLSFPTSPFAFSVASGSSRSSSPTSSTVPWMPSAPLSEPMEPIPMEEAFVREMESAVFDSAWKEA